jgi:cytochrome c oxidase subunit 3
MITSNNNFNTNLKIHPKMFALYLGMGSMVMFFAALSSALLVKRGDFKNWVHVDIPQSFFISTIVILFSSLTMHFMLSSLKNKQSKKYYLLGFLTLILSILFCYFQFNGWNQLKEQNILLSGNPSGSYIYVISGFHALHYIFGILFLLLFLFLFYRNQKYKIETSSIGLNMLANYWHFIGMVWVYIFLFFKFIIYK